tara:strand:+ start:661 stop:858 length:198 start_codon:yes stop_codon:yes gene_type:complete
MQALDQKLVWQCGHSHYSQLQYQQKIYQYQTATRLLKNQIEALDRRAQKILANMVVDNLQHKKSP